MPILVTGVTGQVGGALLKVLGPAGSIVAAGRDQLDLAQPRPNLFSARSHRS